MRRIFTEKLNIKAIAALCLAICFLLGGCHFSGIGENDMLRPPRTTGDEAEIENLISKTAPSGYTLKYPKSGNHRSAIVTADLDGDDVDEAVAFFREKDSVTGVHMLIMYKEDGTWKISSDFETETADVDCIEFTNLDGKGSQEIVVGYATLTPNVNFLTCYRYDRGSTTTIQTGSSNYSAFYCGNLDSSGKSKVITLTIFSPENEARATMLEYDDEKETVFTKSSVSMDPNVIKFKNVAFSDLSENIKGVVVDGAYTSGETTTQVIYFNKQLDVLRNPLNSEKSGNPTKRSSTVISADTDNDMYIEIPTVKSLPEVKEQEKSVAADCVTWNTFDTNTEKLSPKKKVAVNYGFGYSIKLNEKWKQDSFTALNSDNGKLMTFYKLDKGKLGSKLFEIKVIEISDWDQAKSDENDALIYKDTRYAYTFNNIETKGDFAQTDDQIKTAFSVLNEVAV